MQGFFYKNIDLSWLLFNFLLVHLIQYATLVVSVFAEFESKHRKDRPISALISRTLQPRKEVVRHISRYGYLGPRFLLDELPGLTFYGL